MKNIKYKTSKNTGWTYLAGWLKKKQYPVIRSDINLHPDAFVITFNYL